MKRIIMMLAVCAMFMTGCGCSNRDTNNDGIVGNDVVDNKDNNDKNNNTNNSDKNNNMVTDDAIVNNGTNHNSSAGNMVEDAVDGVGDAASDLARGAGRVMNDVGNAMR